MERERGDDDGGGHLDQIIQPRPTKIFKVDRMDHVNDHEEFDDPQNPLKDQQVVNNDDDDGEKPTSSTDTATPATDADCLVPNNDSHVSSPSNKNVKIDEVDFDMDLSTDVDDDESPTPAQKLESIEKNPFLMDRVLKVMMSQMTIEDLKRSRGVSTLWNQHSSKELEKLTPILKPQRFTKPERLQKFATSLENSPNKDFISHGMRSTLQVISNEDLGFFQNFEPKSLTIETAEGDTNVSLKLIEIFQNCSKYIKEFRFMKQETFEVRSQTNEPRFRKILNFVEEDTSDESEEEEYASEPNHFHWYWQFGNNVLICPHIFKFPELEELTLTYFSFGFAEIENITFFLENITKNAPKLKSLCLINQPINRPLCDLFTSYDLFEKLQNLTIIYGNAALRQNGDLSFAQDLLNMAQAGLKLSKFSISITFKVHHNHILSVEDSSPHLGKLNEFLITQSDTLVDLKICLDTDFEKNNHDNDDDTDNDPKVDTDTNNDTDDDDTDDETDDDTNNDDLDFEDIYVGEFHMPPLPKLKVLTIGNDNNKYCIPFNPIDLPSTLPNLREISIVLKPNIYDLCEIFIGSLDSVKKVGVLHPEGNSIEDYTIYSDLETHFPSVVEFEVDKYDMKNWHNQYKNILWEDTLRKLTLHPPSLENLKLGSLSHLEGLNRLELVKKTITMGKYANFDFESLSGTSVKSLKIHNYLVSEELLEKIRNRYTLDYLPSKSAPLLFSKPKVQ